MKRVLHIISQKPSDTGSGVYLQNLIAHGRYNNDSQAIVFGINNNECIEIDIPEKWRYKIQFETDKLPFPIVGMSDVMPYKSSVFSELNENDNEVLINSYKRVVKRAILDFKPDLIFCQHLWLITSVTRTLVEELDLLIPVYGFCHGTDIRQLSLSGYHREKVIFGCKNLDKIFALNEFQIDELEEKYNYERSKIHVVGNGYNSDYFYKNNVKKKNEGRHKIIYAGKLSYSKGVMSLIRSFKELDNKEFELYIAGNGHGSEYMSILEAIEDIENIYYLGKLSQSELGDCFRSSDIFVLPSFYEGLPLVIIEAIACGLKVVCTNINGISKWISKYTDDSNIISFVDLPQMLKIDKPSPNDLSDFEIRLTNSILKVHNSKIDNLDYEFLNELSWKEIFGKLNRLL
ncbi:MAG: glycosyltransferase [Acidaminobacteraceae bacterium]